MKIAFGKKPMDPKGRPAFSAAARAGFFLAVVSLLWNFSPAWAMPPAGYNLVWSDEFNGPVGSAPNGANWTYDTGDGGWGNNELENYTTSTNNSRIVADPNAADGKALAIIAIDTQPGSTNYGAVGRYTSARLLTSGLQSFTYGYMEARIQMPYGDGIWPAFWMLGNNIGSVGWPTCGEMDIMENIGNASDQPVNHGSLHSPGWNPTGTYTLPGGALYHNSYHTFGILWQKDQVQFYVDGTLYETQTASGAAGAGGTYEFNAPFFFLLNMAVGGSWPGSPDASTSFPQTMLVDYVRVYQQPSGTPTSTPTPVVASTWRVNAGGPTYTDSRGNVWSADENHTGGTAAVTTSAIAGALPGAGDQSLYQSQLYGNSFSYVFNVPAGSYQVTLKFAETYWTAAGDRVFNVSINGNTVLANFDIFKAAGGQNLAVDEVFNNIAPSGGAITIQFGPASVDNAVVDAIQIIPEPPTPTATSTLTLTLTPTSTATATPTVTATQTPMLTATSTATDSVTPTRTVTPTNTVTATPTSSASPTQTASSTPSATPTNTPSNTITNSPTATATPTATPTGTAPNNTATDSATPTRTVTPTNTATATPTSSASPTQTASSTPSATPTHTPSNTMTNTPTAPATPTATNTRTVPGNTATNTPTQSPSTSPTHTTTNTPTSTPTPTVTHTLTNTPANTPSSTDTHSPTHTPTNSPTPTATHTATITPTNTNTQSPTGTPTLTPADTFTNTSTPPPTATRTNTPTVTETYTPTLPSTVVISAPFPNPSNGLPVTVEIGVPGESTVAIDVFTSAFRKITGQTAHVSSSETFQWNLRDASGHRVANGLYYVRVHVTGAQAVTKILKVLVLG